MYQDVISHVDHILVHTAHTAKNSLGSTRCLRHFIVMYHYTFEKRDVLDFNICQFVFPPQANLKGKTIKLALCVEQTPQIFCKLCFVIA